MKQLKKKPKNKEQELIKPKKKKQKGLKKPKRTHRTMKSDSLHDSESPSSTTGDEETKPLAKRSRKKKAPRAGSCHRRKSLGCSWRTQRCPRSPRRT